MKGESKPTESFEYTLPERTGAPGAVSGWALLTGQASSSWQSAARQGACCVLLWEGIGSGSFRTPAFMRRFQRIKCVIYVSHIFSRVKLEFQYQDQMSPFSLCRVRTACISCHVNQIYFRIWLCQVICKMWIEYRATGNIVYNSLSFYVWFWKLLTCLNDSMYQTTSKLSGFQKQSFSLTSVTWLEFDLSWAWPGWFQARH